jgi:transposase
MHKIKRIIELKKEGNSIKKISRTLGISKNTVRKYLRFNARENVELKLDNQDKLSKLLLGQSNQEQTARETRLKESLPHLVKELKRVGVTLDLLWQEYKITDPDGYSYSRFCARIKSHKLAEDVTLRLEHKNGYALTVDYLGKKLHYVDKSTGEVCYCEVLVCTLLASQCTYA